MVDPSELIAAAKEAQGRAYAPYSGYPVGAALEDEAGRIFRGCNVENVSYPVGICGERVAIGTMIAGGGSLIRQIAVVTRDGGTPCGMCLQALLEFSDPDETVVHVGDGSDAVTSYRFRDLLPRGFSSKVVKRANQLER